MKQTKIVKKFSKFLTDIKYPKSKTDWDIKGRLKNSNNVFKFDVKEMIPVEENTAFGRYGTLLDKAEKKVFETKDQWIIIDLEELHQYIKKNKLTKVYLNDLIFKLEWTIFIPKKS
jgi:hypothetical protein